MSEPSSADEIAVLKERITFLEEALAASLELNEYYRQQLHGSKSERYDPTQEHLDFGEAVLGKSEPSGPDGNETSEPEGDAQKRKKAKRKRRTKDHLFPRWLKSVIVKELVPEEVKANPELYREIEPRDHRELETTRATIYWRVTRMRRFTRIDDKKEHPISDPAPMASVPGTLCAPQLISQIVCDKFCDHLPHYRQSQRFERRHGIELQRSTINTWTAKLAQYLAPIGLAIKDELLNTEILQIDETPGDYLEPGTGKAQKGYWWAYRNITTGVVYFDWQTSRAMECLFGVLGFDQASKTLLYTGLIQCDGYQVYDKIAKAYAQLSLAGCLAHLRRKFFEAHKQLPEKTIPVLLKIQEIYRVERDMKLSNAPPLCRGLIRASRSRKSFTELKALIDDIAKLRPLPESNLGKALTYALNQWDKVKASFDDARLDLDTNSIENKIRGMKVGLRNYLFLGSAGAGKDAALFYTLIENCKAHGLDPERYFVEIIEALRDPSVDPATLTPAAVAKAKEQGSAPEVGAA